MGAIGKQLYVVSYSTDQRDLYDNGGSKTTNWIMPCMLCRTIKSGNLAGFRSTASLQCIIINVNLASFG